MKPNQVENILARYSLNETGCHVWTGSTNQYGYGQARLNGALVRVHRLAYEHAKGAIPKGHVVMHSCDNRRCINPDHLRLGTQADNLADCRAKGRHDHSGLLNYREPEPPKPVGPPIEPPPVLEAESAKFKLWLEQFRR